MKPRKFRIAINMGYGQIFSPEHIEDADSHNTAATYALRRYFGSVMVEERFADLIPTTATWPASRHVFQVFTYGDGKTYEKAYDVIVDEVDHD